MNNRPPQYVPYDGTVIDTLNRYMEENFATNATLKAATTRLEQAMATNLMMRFEAVKKQHEATVALLEQANNHTEVMTHTHANYEKQVRDNIKNLTDALHHSNEATNTAIADYITKAVRSQDPTQPQVTKEETDYVMRAAQTNRSLQAMAAPTIQIGEDMLKRLDSSHHHHFHDMAKKVKDKVHGFFHHCHKDGNQTPTPPTPTTPTPTTPTPTNPQGPNGNPGPIVEPYPTTPAGGPVIKGPVTTGPWCGTGPSGPVTKPSTDGPAVCRPPVVEQPYNPDWCGTKPGMRR